MAGKSWQQKHKVAAHTASKVRKQRAMDAGAYPSLAFLSIQSESPANGLVPPKFISELSSSVSFSGNIHFQGYVS